MIASVMESYDGLNMDNKELVNDFIFMLIQRQNKEDETLRTIRDARKGIDLSCGYDNVDDLMEALNADN